MHLKLITCWALIFIFRLRFPPGISIATILKRGSIQFIMSSAVPVRPIRVRLGVRLTRAETGGGGVIHRT